MKNIIKQFLDEVLGITRMMPIDKPYLEVHHLLINFDEEYDRFIVNNPIGKAEQEIIGEIYNRARVGYQKYGCTTDRQDLSQDDWKQHLKEELLDSLIYLHKTKQNQND